MYYNNTHKKKPILYTLNRKQFWSIDNCPYIYIPMFHNGTQTIINLSIKWYFHFSHDLLTTFYKCLFISKLLSKFDINITMSRIYLKLTQNSTRVAFKKIIKRLTTAMPKQAVTSQMYTEYWHFVSFIKLIKKYIWNLHYYDLF